MLRQAEKELRLDLDRSWIIGDILNDVEAGHRAGCRSILLNAGNETEWMSGPGRDPEYIASTLIDAAEQVIRERVREVVGCLATPTWTTKLSFDRERLAKRLADRQHSGERIVLTNGCFDILHAGHVRYLSAARALGDALVVGLNSDEGVRRLKGEGRPVNRLLDRAEVLAGLSCVDHVVPFDDQTACELVRFLRPDIYAKGGDYTAQTLPEAREVERYGGAVRIMPFVAARSTSALIERIRGAQ
jgi:rfaE bifunctional protein nucleotidyltransferase chain/domain